MATFKVGENVIDLTTGQQFRVDDGDMELDPSKYGRTTPGFKTGNAKQAVANAAALPKDDGHEFLSKAEDRNATVAMADAQRRTAQPSQPTPSQRRHAPSLPTGEWLAEVGAGPMATAASGFIPGSLPVQMGIGAATEGIGQLLGGKPFDPVQIGVAAATPPAVRGAVQMLKPVARGAAKIFGGENLIKGGIEKVEGLLGKVDADKAAKSTRQAAEAITTPVAQTETAVAVNTILSKRGRVAGVDHTAFDAADELVRNAKNAATTGNPIRYNEIFEQATNFNTLASKAKGADKGAFIDMRQAMLNDLGRVSPEAGEAVKAYRKSATIRDITDELGKAKPERKVADMLKDPLAKGVFTPDQEKTVELIAKQITSAGLTKIGASLASFGALSFAHPGATAAAISPAIIMGALVSAPKIGPVMARSLLGPEGKVSKAAMPALAQMVRGYLASLPEGVNE